jgi:hypothetical protein
MSHGLSPPVSAKEMLPMLQISDYGKSIPDNVNDSFAGGA